MVKEITNSTGEKARFYSKHMLQRRSNLPCLEPLVTQDIKQAPEYFVVFDWLKLKKIILRLLAVA